MKVYTIRIEIPAQVTNPEADHPYYVSPQDVDGWLADVDFNPYDVRLWFNHVGTIDPEMESKDLQHTKTWWRLQQHTKISLFFMSRSLAERAIATFWKRWGQVKNECPQMIQYIISNALTLTVDSTNANHPRLLRLYEENRQVREEFLK